jgi:hypothetical protein
MLFYIKELSLSFNIKVSFTLNQLELESLSKTLKSHLCSREGTRKVRMESEVARKDSGFDHVVERGGGIRRLGCEARSEAKSAEMHNMI